MYKASHAVFYSNGVDPPAIAGSGVRQVLPLENGLDSYIITCGINSGSGPMLDGNPFPTVNWTINGSLITNKSKYTVDNRTLIIREISRNDMGLYECNATNSLGTDRITYSVEIYGMVI